jgi:hypothetical protein
MLVIRIHPAGGCRLVTGLAIQFETGPGVIGIRRGHEVVTMTTAAIDWSAGELIMLLIDVASAAIHYGMNAYQWKSASGMQA